MEKIEKHQEFENIVEHIEHMRGRAFQIVNKELILVYFDVGLTVSKKVAAGSWDDNTVGELADFLQNRYKGYGSFTISGLYRMKQFYEVYTSDDFVKPLEKQLEAFFEPAVPTNLEETKIRLFTELLCKITWTNHLEILSKAKSPKERFFYLVNCLHERWSLRDLRRRLDSDFYSKAMILGKVVTPTSTRFPQDLFEEPYILEFFNLPLGQTKKDLEKD